ncbi:MAG: hypothetical protein KDC92_08405 [Bacteroidetes bacterium]|nr:hypothetical protein [Bacteroidota bacterium]
MEQEIQSLRSRPRFKKAYKASIDNIIESFVNYTNGHELVTGSASTQYLFLRLHQHNEKLWTPRLSIALEEIENGVLLRGLYAPRPAIWTGVIFCYAMLSFGAIAALFWGFTQQMNNTFPFGFWIVPGCLLTIGGIYLLSQFGQKLSYHQMEILQKSFNEITSQFSSLHIDENEN